MRDRQQEREDGMGERRNRIQRDQYRMQTYMDDDYYEDEDEDEDEYFAESQAKYYGYEDDYYYDPDYFEEDDDNDNDDYYNDYFMEDDIDSDSSLCNKHDLSKPISPCWPGRLRCLFSALDHTMCFGAAHHGQAAKRESV